MQNAHGQFLDVFEKLLKTISFVFSRQYFQDRSISRKKPMSSMRSASSKTRISTLASDIKPWFCKSINLEWPLKYRFLTQLCYLWILVYTKKITVLLGLKFTVFFDIGQYLCG
jgi:hypothetical protein